MCYFGLIATVIIMIKFLSHFCLVICRITSYKRRQIEGCLARVPEGFYQKVWNVLKKTPSGIAVQGHFLAQQPTLSNMTMSELNFSLLVEDMLFEIPKPEYRQLIVEVIELSPLNVSLIL